MAERVAGDPRAQALFAVTPPLLPLLEDGDDEYRMALRDAGDVFNCLNHLMFEEYQAWKDGLYERAWAEMCTCSDADSDPHGWGQREAERRYAELLNEGRAAKHAELHQRVQDAFDWWWSAEKVKLREGKRVRRTGETY